MNAKLFLCATLCVLAYSAVDELADKRCSESRVEAAEVPPPHPVPPHIAYIEESDGRYSICESDQENGVLLKWKGVRIPQKWLPQFVPERKSVSAGSESVRYIYKRGRGKSQEAPIVSLLYGPIPFPVREVDPPMLCGMSLSRNDLLVGFFLRGEFFIITQIKQPRMKVRLKTYDWCPPYHFIDVPLHRKDELKKRLSEVIENVPDGVLNDKRRNASNTSGEKK